MAVIEARGLVKEFRRPVPRPGLAGALRDLLGRRHATVRAVDGLDLTVEAGEIVGYIGANGAGKSTTIKLLTGILVPTAGELRVAGMVPWRDRERFVRRIGVAFGQRSALWWDLPVRESFRLLQRMYGVPEAEFRRRLDELDGILGIGELLGTPVRRLSLGQRMRCELAAALLHGPEILFLDEPTIGLDVVVKLRVREFLREVNRRYGTTIFLTTHDLTDVEALCPRVVVLHRGRVVFDGSREDLRRAVGAGRVLQLTLDRPVPAEGLAPALDGLGRLERVDELTLRVYLPEDGQEGEPAAGPVLGRLLATLPVRDVTVEEPSMEEVVRRIYLQTGASD